MYQDIPKPTSEISVSVKKQDGSSGQIPSRPWYLFLANIFSIFGPEGIVSVDHGGTGLNETAQGALLYGEDADEYGLLLKTATASYLDNSGTTNNPAWSAKAALTRTNDTNVTLTLGGTPATSLLAATSLTMGWSGLLGLSRGGTNADLSATGGTAQVLKQTSVGGAVTVSTVAASEISSPAALTRTSDTNVILTLGGSPSSALLAATSLTLSWSGFLGLARGGTNADLSATGGSGQVLKQTSVGGAVTVGTVSGADITGDALTKSDDANVTLTLGGTPATALLRAASITAGWTGQLSLTRGGTNASLTASNGGIVYSDASGFAVLSGTATAGQILRSGASSAPTWSTATYPSTVTAGRVLLATAANVVGDGPAPIPDGTYTIDATTPGSLTSLTFTNGIATGRTTLP